MQSGSLSLVIARACRKFVIRLGGGMSFLLSVMCSGSLGLTIKWACKEGNHQAGSVQNYEVLLSFMQPCSLSLKASNRNIERDAIKET